jgi:hypothetical protein
MFIVLSLSPFLLLQAYKILSEMETQTADDRANNQHERALQEFFVRTQPIGELSLTLIYF